MTTSLPPTSPPFHHTSLPTSTDLENLPPSIINSAVVARVSLSPTDSPHNNNHDNNNLVNSPYTRTKMEVHAAGGAVAKSFVPPPPTTPAATATPNAASPPPSSSSQKKQLRIPRGSLVELLPDGSPGQINNQGVKQPEYDSRPYSPELYTTETTATTAATATATATSTATATATAPTASTSSPSKTDFDLPSSHPSSSSPFGNPAVVQSPLRRSQSEPGGRGGFKGVCQGSGIAAAKRRNRNGNNNSGGNNNNNGNGDDDVDNNNGEKGMQITRNDLESSDQSGVAPSGSYSSGVGAADALIPYLHSLLIPPSIIPSYHGILSSHGYDTVDSLKTDITKEELVQMGIKVGHAKRILRRRPPEVRQKKPFFYTFFCVALRCVALRCVALRCVVLRCVALCCVVLCCVVLRCVALLC